MASPSMVLEIQRKADKIAYSIAAKRIGAPVKAAFDQTLNYKAGMLGQEFYRTRQWRELRYQAFRLHGNKCQCCSASNVMLHVDHIKPRSTHPGLELQLDNLQILCEPCNIGKSNKDATDWRK